MIRVDVVCALHLRQDCVELELPDGATVQDAVAQSELLDGLTPQARTQFSFGVWGRNVTPDFVLEEGDRVELLRPLQADPKEVRRKRAAAKR